MIMPDDPLGKFKRIYLAKTKSKEIASIEGVSGGAVTSILCYLLDNNIVDAVVTVKKDVGIEGKVVIARNTREVLEAAGSKWSLVPYMKVLKDAIYEHSLGKVAIVGLPCQISFLRQMKNFPLLETDFGEKIHLLIGLFCIGTFAQEVFKSFIMREYGIDAKVIRDIRIEGENLVIYTDTKEKHTEIPIAKLLKYLQTGCLLCGDYTAVSSDISAGVLPNHPGTTVIIARSNESEEILNDAEKKGYLKIFPASRDVVEEIKCNAIEKMKRAKMYMENIL